MLSQEYDLRYLRASLEELKTYLLSKELYWPLGVSAPAGYPPYPHITVANLLLSITRLRARREYVVLGDDKFETEYLKLMDAFEEIIRKWRSAWESKAEREFMSRLGQWSQKLGELRRDNMNSAGYYRGAIRDRALLELLAGELGQQTPAEHDLLLKLDTQLRGITIDRDFLWDEDLESGFPKDKFWFLYRITK